MSPSRSRRAPTQQRALDTRQRIVDAAAALFASSGVAATSTNRIAAHARMSIGSLYRYFANKEQIVDVVRAQVAAALEEAFTAAALSGVTLPPREGIALGIRGIVTAIGAHRELLRALLADARVEGLGFEAVDQRLQLLTRAYLLHHLGPRPDAELDERAYVMVSVGLAAAYRIGHTPPPGLDTDRLVDETAHLLAAWIADS
jgi:AcrR family transcriptional regulator